MSRWSIRKKLQALLLVLFLPMFGIVIVTGVTQRQNKIDEARNNAQLVANSLAAQQDQIAGSTKTMLTLLAQLPEVRHADAAKCNQLFTDIHRRFPYFTVVLAVTPDGNVFASSMPFRPGTINLADRKHVRDAIRTRDFSVGEYIVGRVSNARSINYTYPAFDERGNLSAIVIAGFNLDAFSGFLSRVQLGEGSAAMFTDWKGVRLFRIPETPTVKAGVAVAPDVFRLISGASHQGTYQRVGQDGESRIYAFTQLRLKEDAQPYMYAIVGIAEKPILRSANLVLLKELAILGIALLLAAAATWFYADAVFIRPMNHLVEATKRFGAGESIVRTGVAHKADELGQFAQSFDEAMELLETRDAERKKAESDLLSAHAETEFFLACIPSIVIGLNSEGRIKRWNSAAVRAFAIDANQAVGRRLDDCGVQWLKPEIRNESAGWLAATGLISQIFAYQREGMKRYLDVVIQPIHGPDGATGLILTGNDITQRKFLEVQLQQAQKLEAVGQLAAGIAHEINTPLQFSGDNVRFLKESWPNLSELLRLSCRVVEEMEKGGIQAPTSAELQSVWQHTDASYLIGESASAIDQALEGLERISKIVQAMRELSHPGSKEKTSVDINHAIEITITVARNEWKFVADVKTQLDPHLPHVTCYASELNQVLLNLIVNAAQAIAGDPARTPNGKGMIVITTMQRPDAVGIAIQDSGPGIPEEIRSRIFEPFFTTKPIGKGTGQGLALAHSVIVQRHRGKIWFESVAGVGTTFFIELPLNASEQPSDGAARNELADRAPTPLYETAEQHIAKT
jgi:signal transduction histidine kinase